MSITTFFSIIGLIILFPLFCLILASFKPSTELLRFGLNLKLQPDILSLDNYTFLFDGGKIYLKWYLNSTIIVFLYTALSLFFSSLIGYGLGVYNFKGKNLIFTLVLFILMVPIEILILPLFELSVSLRVINSYMGIILPFVVSPVAVFFFRQFAIGLPKELLDAARIDGCSELGIFFRIMMPLMKPAFGAMAILQAMNSWNNFLWPLIVMRSKEMFTLPVGLTGLLSPYGNNYDMLISGSVLTVLPILILFLFFQRYFISGLTVGGVKG
ncbi:carbohydrate ABC transporter permease [Priestia endophytica]|uniref:carbohydrate ABC transporter permease n=1 Tax=Priestia endophytica TaxID=135735 RepID=UPI003555E5F8